MESSSFKRPMICYILGVVLIAYLILSGILIVLIHLNVYEQLLQFQLLRVHLLCGSFGMLGASMAAIRKYYRRLITEEEALKSGEEISPFDWRWGRIFYYSSRPLLGAALGAIIYTLTSGGFLVIAESSSIKISSEGRYLLYGISFLCGFSVSQVLDRLGELSDQIFKTIKGE